MIIYATKIIIDKNDLAYIIELHNENKIFFEKIYNGLMILKDQYDNVDTLKHINSLLDTLNELHIKNTTNTISTKSLL